MAIVCAGPANDSKKMRRMSTLTWAVPKKSASLGFVKIESQAALVFIIEGIAVSLYPFAQAKMGTNPSILGVLLPSPVAV